MTREINTYAVEPARLEYGTWCHRSEKQLGRGDIAASYSADRIGMDQPVRRPFGWDGSLWISVGSGAYDGVHSHNAYRLVIPSQFDGTPTTYGEKLREADAARADPLGFYHGMTVRFAGACWVLCGPPAHFVPGATQQLDLFG